MPLRENMAHARQRSVNLIPIKASISSEIEYLNILPEMEKLEIEGNYSFLKNSFSKGTSDKKDLTSSNNDQQ